MDRSEKWKTLMCFALFGCVVTGLCIRLTYLQAVRAEPNRKSVKRARDVYEPLPFARGDIVDRMGKLLAYDRLTLSVRAEFQARVPKGAPRIPDTIMDFLASRLASNLIAGDPERGSRSVLAKKLGKRMRIAPHKLMPSKFRTVDYLSVDFLVCGDLDSHESVRRLRLEANLWRSKKKMPGRLHLSITKNYTRTYPDREFTFGPVGNHYIAERKAKTASGRTRTVRYEDHMGLESCSVLWPEKPALRALSRPHQLDFKDSRRRRFWTGLGVDPRRPSRLHCTIDLELQKAAHAELRVAAKAVTDHYKSSFEWGAIVLVDLELGDILAMASHYPGRKGATPFAPVENAFEPGSVVKPLVIGYALEQGKVGWHDSIDCTPTRPRNGRPVDGHPGRTIRDDHRCGVLTTREVIVQSSNIGAVKIGTRLGRSGMRDYLRHYGFCTKTDIGLPRETRGRGPEGGIEALPEMRERKFGRFTGPSLSFGYELNVTAVQLARAYLRLLSGRERELRLVSAVETGSKTVHAPSGDKPQTGFLSKDTIEKIRDAMAGVVSEEHHATGRHLYKMIKDLGHAQPLMAGKTGTSDSPIGGIAKKTAAFVGFAPVAKPRYLVVCVLRKDRAGRFYGGSYAALPAGRLLLAALALQQKIRSPRSKQVRAWKGVRGSSSSKKKSGGS
jgi:cell division protein FtsI/penicillin-binding protein 2